MKFLPFLFILAACSTAPQLKSFFAGDGVVQYFLSPTNWSSNNSNAQLDITLTATIDVLVYVYKPDKNFINLKNKFLATVSYY
uniref:Uncharacterized protein n=1 Tax=uncultured bacterium contig00019 TaxID=1181510 RepID=A0A806K011_9BACT|nr:hypothetical protein [uncultured bacterium contig00019]